MGDSRWNHPSKLRQGIVLNGVPSVPLSKVVVVSLEHWRGKYLSLSEKVDDQLRLIVCKKGGNGESGLVVQNLVTNNVRRIAKSSS